ncbi:hypothetical protein AWB91_24535 [Mycobacterium paraense]|uniref:PNPLA domain-containing protein n=1 Tax=Mycobacterium paraense TaxID=767916 RepID=A0ABX3VI44_9MYCO|nr:hypothetical protein AWB91_24535 [Mycobacterium paraense]ORW40353.1 hypothetical protein AWB88_13540 [Mycobacterium paraense]
MALHLSFWRSQRIEKPLELRNILTGLAHALGVIDQLRQLDRCRLDARLVIPSGISSGALFADGGFNLTHGGRPDGRCDLTCGRHCHNLCADTLG